MQHLPNMIDMAITPVDDEEKNEPVEMAAYAPKYPYGLSICLTQAELDKLEVDASDWEVGDIFHLFAFAKVTSISQTETQDGEKCSRVEMQITNLSGENEDLENEEEDFEEVLPERHGRNPYGNQ